MLHRETEGGVHVHVPAARCDLETGKSLNIAPLGWQKTFDALRDSLNYEHGWSRQDDPEPARVVQPGHRAGVEATRLRAGLAVEPEPRELIRDYLVERIQSRIETKASLELEIERLQESPEGRFVVLPPGTLDHPPWTVGGRPAVRLSTK